MKEIENYIVHLLAKKYSSFDALNSVSNLSPIQIISILKNLEDEKVIQSMWKKEHVGSKENQLHLKKIYTVSNKEILNHQTNCSKTCLIRSVNPL